MLGYPVSSSSSPWNPTTGIATPQVFFDHFYGTNYTTPPWVLFGGSVTSAVQPNGVLKFAADAIAASELHIDVARWYRAGNPTMEFRCYTSTLATGCRLGFADSTVTRWQWGARFDPALSNNWGIYNKNGAGAEVFTPSATPVVLSTWYRLRVWLTGAVGAQTIHLTINGLDETLYNAVQPDADNSLVYLWVGNTGGAGTGLYIDWVGVAIDYNQPPA